MKVAFALMPKKDEKEPTMSRSGKREFQKEGTSKISKNIIDENKVSCWKKGQMTTQDRTWQIGMRVVGDKVWEIG